MLANLCTPNFAATGHRSTATYALSTKHFTSSKQAASSKQQAASRKLYVSTGY